MAFVDLLALPYTVFSEREGELNDVGQRDQHSAFEHLSMNGTVHGPEIYMFIDDALVGKDMTDFTRARSVGKNARRSLFRKDDCCTIFLVDTSTFS